MAWWWTLARLMYGRVKSLQETAALDPDHLPPPKTIWFDDDELERWFESRRELEKMRRETT